MLTENPGHAQKIKLYHRKVSPEHCKPCQERGKRLRLHETVKVYAKQLKVYEK